MLVKFHPIRPFYEDPDNIDYKLVLPLLAYIENKSRFLQHTIFTMIYIFWRKTRRSVDVINSFHFE